MLLQILSAQLQNQEIPLYSEYRGISVSCATRTLGWLGWVVGEHIKGPRPKTVLVSATAETEKVGRRNQNFT